MQSAVPNRDQVSPTPTTCFHYPLLPPELESDQYRSWANNGAVASGNLGGNLPSPSPPGINGQSPPGDER